MMNAIDNERVIFEIMLFAIDPRGSLLALAAEQ